MSYYKCLIGSGSGGSSSVKPKNYDTYKAKSTLSENEFIDFVDSGCIEYALVNGDRTNWLKKNIQLNNSQISNSTYNIYQIADFNHDGTSYTVDLIAKNTIISKTFDSTDNDYINSDIRTWLNNTYYNGFGFSTKCRMVNMTVKTDRLSNAGTGQGGTSQTTSDKVKLLSCAEIGLSTSAHSCIPNKDEGSRYPIFNASTTTSAVTDRVRTGANSYWWLRSRYTATTSNAWYVYSDGSMGSNGYNIGRGILPALRFQSYKYTLDPDRVLSQEEFITLLSNGFFKSVIDNNKQSDWILREVKLRNSSNEVIDKYNIYQIADFNHDGTSYTVDLIAKYTVIQKTFDSSDNDYINSDIRTWLNNTYYNGFDIGLRDKMINMTVKTDRVGSSAGTGQNGTSQTISNKVKLLSIDELGITSKHQYMPTANEGNKYPIFTNTGTAAATDRVRTGADSYWWLRSRNTYNTSFAWSVYSDGSVNNNYYYGSYGILPALRFQIDI